MKRLLVLLAVLTMCLPARASFQARVPPQQDWSFAGPFGTYDRGALQRGFQVYREICSACHGMTLLSFHDLSAPGGPGFGADTMQKILDDFAVPAEPNERGEILDENGVRLTRAARLSDHLPPAFANTQLARLSNSGALPPDLSLIVKARRRGADYVYALLMGFGETPPKGFALQEGRFFNPYFDGGNIAMVPPLADEAVSYADGTKATVAQEARDVVTYLAWASDPKLEARHRVGLEVMAFLVLFAGLLFLSYRTVWRGEK